MFYRLTFSAPCTTVLSEAVCASWTQPARDGQDLANRPTVGRRPHHADRACRRQLKRHVQPQSVATQVTARLRGHPPDDRLARATKSKLGIPFHFLAIQNPVRRGTAVAGASRARLEGSRGSGGVIRAPGLADRQGSMSAAALRPPLAGLPGTAARARIHRTVRETAPR